MITLKELVTCQDYSEKSDMDIIREWFVKNNYESEGIELMAMLSKSKSDKLQNQLNIARIWIPVLPKPYEPKMSKDVSEQLYNITIKFLLGMDLSGDLLNWAKEMIPSMKTPTIIFVPMVEWLKDKYNIEFKDK